MVISRTCKAIRSNGESCRAAPLRDSPFCLWHDPDQADVVAEARRLGGVRRKRETTLAGAYDIEGLGSVAEIRRIVEIAVLDALSLENSVARGRLLVACALAGAKLLEVGELDERLTAVEATLKPRLVKTGGRR
jgi:hypothetical protein